MRRQIIPSSINTGDTLLVSSKSLLSEAIQTFQKCKWNHAGMFLWINNLLYVCEATEKGVVITLFSKFEARDEIGLLILKPTPAVVVDEKKYIDFMLPYVGHTNYGFFDLLIAQAVRFITRRRVWIGSKKETKRFICGEFVAHVYNHFNPWLFTKWHQVAPVDLFEASGPEGFFTNYVYK